MDSLQVILIDLLKDFLTLQQDGKSIDSNEIVELTREYAEEIYDRLDAEADMFEARQYNYNVPF